MRRGLKQSTDTVKKGFVALLSYIVSVLGKPVEGVVSAIHSGDGSSMNYSSMSVSKHSSSSSAASAQSALTSSVWTQLNESFHSDLFSLLHEDPEQDFFENINHIQLHRRVRAFAKLRLRLKNAAIQLNSLAFQKNSSVIALRKDVADKMMLENNNENNENDEGDENDASLKEAISAEPTTEHSSEHLSQEHSQELSLIGISSLSHVLLPLALHPLVSEEFKKKDHLTLLQESAAFVGSIGEHSLQP